MTMTIIMTPTATTVVVKTTELVNKTLSKETMSSRKILKISMLAKVTQKKENARIHAFCLSSLLSWDQCCI
jgi:hypothetical protein